MLTSYRLPSERQQRSRVRHLNGWRHRADYWAAQLRATRFAARLDETARARQTEWTKCPRIAIQLSNRLVRRGKPKATHVDSALSVHGFWRLWQRKKKDAEPELPRRQKLLKHRDNPLIDADTSVDGDVIGDEQTDTNNDDLVGLIIALIPKKPK